MAYTTIDDPTSFFNTILYTGDGNTSRGITGVGFQPDWLWIKRRDATEGHVLFDVVRSADARLQSNNGNAEADRPNIVYSFDSDGFSVSQSDIDNASNNNGGTYVAWNWKAGGSASSNSNGSITSSVSANTTAGFSIVSYTGNSTSGATVGHGLSSAPKFVIGKARNTSGEDWFTGNASNGFDKYIKLNDTHAAQTFSGVFHDTAPSSTVVTLGSNGIINSSSYNYIMYCFSEVKGYSKIGSYKGNGNADGTFVYTGFRPTWILLKQSSTSGAGWRMHDTKRGISGNPEDETLYASANNAESTGRDVDFLSNGFKLRTDSGDGNSSGATYIYLAFAESPFVNSNGIPTNAR